MSTVLIFDSGVGGLSISLSLSQGLPNARQYYLADGLYFPYGNKEEQWLVQRVVDLLGSAVNQLKPDCIVIACNTVSTIALEALRKEITVPIVGVVPAIKPAAEHSVSKSIALLATPRTIASKYTAELIHAYAKDCEVTLIGSTELVEIAESRIYGCEIHQREIADVMNPLIDANKISQLDQLVLGCTHFPLVADLISEYLEREMPNSIHLVDSSEAITRQVAKILSISPTNEIANESLAGQFYNTKPESKFDSSESEFLVALASYGFNVIKYFSGAN